MGILPVPSIEEKDFCKRSNVNKSREVAVCLNVGILQGVADADLSGEVYNKRTLQGSRLLNLSD